MDGKYLGLYIHIPFCLQKCLYCDFPSYSQMDALYDTYIAALCREIAAQSGIFHDYQVDSIYIGGGTPTVLPANLLAQLVECLQYNFILTPSCEISMEANPGTIDMNKLSALSQIGINRLSLGVQSFNDRLLAAVGRIHTAKEAIDSIESAKQAGFNNINIDLMYGLPGQSLKEWQHTLNVAVSLDIQHISAYGLKLEEGTPLFEGYQKGKVMLPDEMTEEAMYDYKFEFLPLHGYRRYEISNYSKQEKECRHNLKYWQYQPYIGFGAAACSFWNGCRFSNQADVKGYIKAVDSRRSPVDFTETPPQDVAIAEFIFLALRTIHGVKFNLFKEKFGTELLDIYSDIVKDLVTKKLLMVNEYGVCLTAKGMKYGNLVFEAFLP